MEKDRNGKPQSGHSGSRDGTGFQRDFGDFHVVRAAKMRCGPSPNGHYVGMWFELATGESVKISVPIAHAQEFGGDFDAALKSASEHLAQNYDDPAGIA